MTEHIDISLLISELGENSVDAHASCVHIALSDICDGYLLVVKDDGDGMSGDKLSKACDKGASFKGSSGLGLSVVKALSKTLRISSEEGIGTQVTLTASLPLGDIAASVAVIMSVARVKLDMDLNGKRMTLDTYGCTSPADIVKARDKINNFLS